jgi:hypothetical protein
MTGMTTNESFMRSSSWSLIEYIEEYGIARMRSQKSNKSIFGFKKIVQLLTS